MLRALLSSKKNHPHGHYKLTTKNAIIKKRFSNPHQQITVKPVETRRGASKIKPYRAPSPKRI